MLELLFLFSVAAEVGRSDSSVTNLNQKYKLDQTEIKIVLAELNPQHSSICKYSRNERRPTLKINETNFNKLNEEKQKDFVLAQVDSCKKRKTN